MVAASSSGGGTAASAAADQDSSPMVADPAPGTLVSVDGWGLAVVPGPGEGHVELPHFQHVELRSCGSRQWLSHKLTEGGSLGACC